MSLRCSCGAISFQGVYRGSQFVPLCGGCKERYDRAQLEKTELAALRTENEKLRLDLATAAGNVARLTRDLKTTETKRAALESELTKVVKR